MLDSVCLQLLERSRCRGDCCSKPCVAYSVVYPNGVRTTYLLVFFLFHFLFVVNSAWAQKTDVIELKNGDRLTGDIKGLERGKLEFKTDTMDTVYVKWQEIISLQSRHFHEVESVSGRVFYGTLTSDRDSKSVIVHELGERIEIPLIDIVRISPIKEGWWLPVNASLRVGLSFTRASEVTQFTLGGDFRYRTRRYIFAGDASSIITAQPDRATSERYEFGVGYARLLPDRWFWLAATSLERNTELGVRLRALAGGSGGRFILQTSRSELALAAGLVLNQEWASETGARNSELEGRLDFNHRYYIYQTPKKEIHTRLSVFPGISNRDRIRTSLDSRFKLELMKDLFWEMQVYHTYDSSPPQAAVSTTDYGVVTSFGWSI